MQGREGCNYHVSDASYGGWFVPDDVAVLELCFLRIDRIMTAKTKKKKCLPEHGHEVDVVTLIYHNSFNADMMLL